MVLDNYSPVYTIEVILLKPKLVKFLAVHMI